MKGNPRTFCGGGIWNTAQGVQNPTNDWNSNKDWHPKPGIQNPWRGIQNPRLSWIPLRIWGNIRKTRLKKGVSLFLTGLQPRPPGYQSRNSNTELQETRGSQGT